MSGTPPPTSIQDEILNCLVSTDVVVIAGTGVSLQSIGHPGPGTEVAGWQGLLESGVKYCESKGLVKGPAGASIVRGQINSGDTSYLIDAAQKIHEWMETRSSARFFWFKETIGKLKIVDPSLITAIRGLGGLIATLNYDGLLEEVTNLPCVTWQDREDLSKRIRSIKDRQGFIFHIHGHWEKIHSVILDRTSYETITKDDNLQSIMHWFAQMYTIIFIGCGNTFNDPNFETLLNWCGKALKETTHRHYIFCREEEESKFIEELKPYGFIEPVVYGREFSDLTPFVSNLANEFAKRNSATNSIIKELNEHPPINDFNVQKATDIWNLQFLR